MPWRSLPDGAFVALPEGPALVRGDAVVPWTPQAYAARVPRPIAGVVDVLTPPSTLGVLRAGYVPQIDAATG
jgi:hypothetical protein